MKILKEWVNRELPTKVNIRRIYRKNNKTSLMAIIVSVDGLIKTIFVPIYKTGKGIDFNVYNSKETFEEEHSLDAIT